MKSANLNALRVSGLTTRVLSRRVSRRIQQFFFALLLLAIGTTVTARGCFVTIQHNASDRRVQISTDGNSGTAALQSPPGNIKCTIQDRNVRNTVASVHSAS